MPLFTLSGVEGHIFGPMAKTYAYALAGGLLATFTVTPAISAILLPEHVRETETIGRARAASPVYAGAALRGRQPGARDRRRASLLVLAGVAGALARARIPAQARRGQSVDPRDHAVHHLARGRQRLRQPHARRSFAAFRRSRSVVSQHGRPDDGTDAAGFFNAEFFAPLKPVEQWRSGLGDKDDLTAEILGKLKAEFPGVEFNFSQYLQDNVAEAVSGVKGENSDQAVRQRSAGALRHRQQDQGGAGDRARHHRSCGVHLARPADGADRHRSRAGGALRPHARRHQRDDPRGDRRRHRRATFTSPAATGISRSWCGSRRSSGRIRPPSRICASACRGRTASRRSRSSDVATVKLVSGASYIYREGQERYLPIKFSVRDRDLGSAIQEAQTQGRRAGDVAGRDRGWNGSASSATCRTRSRGSRSWCRSASR